MLALVSLFALAFPAQAPVVPPAAARSPLDRSVVIVLARDASGTSASAVHTVPDDFTGSYDAWFRAEEPSGLVMEVVEPSGRVHRTCAWAERGPLPYAILVVKPGDRWTLRVRGPPEAAGRAVELRLFAQIQDEQATAALADASERLGAARAHFEAGERAAAEALLDEGADLALAALRAKGQLELVAAAWQFGVLANERGVSRTALRVFEGVHEHLAQCVPEDNWNLQQGRDALAGVLLETGDLERALDLRRHGVAVAERTYEPGAPELRRARCGLAATLLLAQDIVAARDLSASIVRELEPSAAPDDVELLWMKEVLATALRHLGELAEAEEIASSIVDVLERSVPAENPDLVRARINLAGLRLLRGDAAGAAAEFETALRQLARRYPEDHADVLGTRQNLAAARRDLGDLVGARALEEAVLAARERSLPDENPDVQIARKNLARTLKMLGDAAAARVLEERVLAIEERLYPDDHPDLVITRNNLAVTLGRLGDTAGARQLRDAVRQSIERRFPPDHPERIAARGLAALNAFEEGDYESAYAIYVEVLAGLEHAASFDPARVATARHDVAILAERTGRFAEAEEQGSALLAERERDLPAGHPDVQLARESLAFAIASRVREQGDALGADARVTAAVRALALVRDHARFDLEAARAAILGGSAREAEERCAALAAGLETVLAFARGAGAFEPDAALLSDAFALSETTRAAGLAAASRAGSGERGPEFARLRAELREASAVLAALAQRGAPSDEVHAARARRETAERTLVALAGDAAAQDLVVDAGALAARLPNGAAAVAYRRIRTTHGSLASGVDSIGAFVVRRGKSGAPILRHVDLGPVTAIESAVRAWRVAIGTGAERGLAAADAASGERAAGDALRRLAWDPLLPALGDATSVLVVLDDVLHLVPLDALPLDALTLDAGRQEEPQLLGARWHVETRVSLRDLLRPLPAVAPGGALVAMGGAAFQSEPARLADADVDQLAPADPVEPAAGRGLRSWDRAFTPLTYTGLEAREIAALHEEVFGEGSRALTLEKRRASREALLEAAPSARFLHVATHGWFAPESVHAWDDAAAGADARGVGRASAESIVRGMSPMLLTGLALAGANRPPDAAGRVPGLVTAEELSTLDLSRCELAVLSACDTNVGERRAGQGVASLQKALHMAGARSVITSLWKVPDEATRELMLDFYRRLWVDRKPKSVALWEAKMRLRDARDETGARIHATRDWAAWVLTGAPD